MGEKIMRRIIAAIAVAAGLTLTTAACSGGGGSVSTQPAKTPTAHAKPAAKPKPAAKAKPAGIGDTIHLKGDEAGATLDATVVKVNDDAKATDGSELDSPSKDRWVGVQLRLVNTGTAVYSDSPLNGAQITDTDGQQFGDAFVDISDGPSMASDVRLTTGNKTLGWVVFEVPKASKLNYVQFAMDSGLADQAAQWNITT